MRDTLLTILHNYAIARDMFEIRLAGDVGECRRPGTFVNLKIEGCFLRRPISVCDVQGDRITLIVKRVGKGTEALSESTPGAKIWTLTGLGNGYDVTKSGRQPLLVGGGSGVAPLFGLCKALLDRGAKPMVALGFASSADAYYVDEFRALGVDTRVTTMDGSLGAKGFATDGMPDDYTYTYACGPEPMLKAVYRLSRTSGQYSFEERMGCGFGACMGCSCKTITGYKRICRDGPVLEKEEILWPTRA